jgi:hypothetical protein
LPIGRGEQRENDPSGEDEQSKQNAQVHEPAFAEATAGRSGRRNSPRARDPMWELSGAFLFHGRGVPLKLGFLRQLDARCRDYLSMSHRVWDGRSSLLPFSGHRQSSVNENR